MLFQFLQQFSGQWTFSDTFNIGQQVFLAAHSGNYRGNPSINGVMIGGALSQGKTRGGPVVNIFFKV